MATGILALDLWVAQGAEEDQHAGSLSGRPHSRQAGCSVSLFALPSYPFLGEGSPTKIDYRKKGTLILTSLLEDLVADLRQC